MPPLKAFWKQPVSPLENKIKNLKQPRDGGGGQEVLFCSQIFSPARPAQQIKTPEGIWRIPSSATLSVIVIGSEGEREAKEEGEKRKAAESMAL